jgi:hypothetical protein
MFSHLAVTHARGGCRITNLGGLGLIELENDHMAEEAFD